MGLVHGIPIGEGGGGGGGDPVVSLVGGAAPEQLPVVQIQQQPVQQYGGVLTQDGLGEGVGRYRKKIVFQQQPHLSGGVISRPVPVGTQAQLKGIGFRVDGPVQHDQILSPCEYVIGSHSPILHSLEDTQAYGLANGGVGPVVRGQIRVLRTVGGKGPQRQGKSGAEGGAA